MSKDGPVLELSVSVSRARRYALTRFGSSIPEPVRVRALIDTGATFSCLDTSVFARLNISSKGTVPTLTPGTGDVFQLLNRYDVDLEALASREQNLFLFTDFPVLEASLAAQGIHALIGRDILNRCLFLFDGPNVTFSLSL